MIARRGVSRHRFPRGDNHRTTQGGLHVDEAMVVTVKRLLELLVSQGYQRAAVTIWSAALRAAESDPRAVLDVVAPGGVLLDTADQEAFRRCVALPSSWNGSRFDDRGRPHGREDEGIIPVRSAQELVPRPRRPLEPLCQIRVGSRHQCADVRPGEA